MSQQQQPKNDNEDRCPKCNSINFDVCKLMGNNRGIEPPALYEAIIISKCHNCGYHNHQRKMITCQERHQLFLEAKAKTEHLIEQEIKNRKAEEQQDHKQERYSTD